MDNLLAMENPFTPSFGEIPLFMAGRTQLIDSLDRAFSRNRRSPELSLLISGARGSGKTALLGKISAEAQVRGWISVDVTAGPEMLEDILALGRRNAAHIIPADNNSRVTGIGIPQILSIELEQPNASLGNWRVQLEDLVNMLESAGSGLLITVDEVRADSEEMVRLTATYQHLVRDNHRVALIMAGLPYNIETLKTDKTISFVRRAQHERLARIPDTEVAHAIRQTVEEGGRHIADDALEFAVKSAAGFPFMIQLVGYRMWNETPDTSIISLADTQRGAERAREELRDRILESTLRELSNGDIAFLQAMLQGGETSTINEIAERMGKTNAYASTYKTRLLKHGVIGQHSRTGYGFELPGFREYLAEELER